MPVALAAIPAVASVAAAGITAGLGGGSSKTTTGTQTQESSHTPYGQQGADYNAAWDDANTAYAAEMQRGPYSGSYYAPLNDIQNGAINGAANYGAGMGQQVAGNAANVSNILTGAATPYLNNAQNLAANGIGGPNASLMNTLTGAATGSGTGLSSALNQAATAGANSIGNYNSGLASIMSQGMSDPTQQLANDAQSYMNSSATQSAIDSTNAQIDRTLNQQTVPGLNRQAAMGGALNSSRAGAAEAQAQGDAALAKATADSSIQNNAYNQGLATASAQRTAGLNTASNAAQSGLATNGNLALGTGNQQVNAANSGLTNGLSYSLGNANTQLSANSQLGQAISTGLIAGNDSTAQQQAIFNLMSGAGGMQQQDANNQLAADQLQYNTNNNYQMQELQNYINTVAGAGQFYNASQANSGTSTTTGASGLGNLIGGGVATVGAQFAPGGALSGLFNNSGNSALAQAQSSYNPLASMS